MTDQKNTILAIVLSGIVLLAWQYFIGGPQMEKQRQEALLKQQQQQTQVQPAQPGQPVPQAQSTAAPAAPQVPGAPTTPEQQKAREAAVAASPRIAVETSHVRGSISLRGGRIDDLQLVQYRETVDPKSAPITLLAPSGSPHPFYAEFGWVGTTGASAKVPGADTLWTQQGSGSLGVGKPVTLTWNNGEGLEFRRTIAVDEKYLFTVDDTVANKTTAPISLFPYALISRHGTPATLGYYILHEGLIGVFGDQGLEEHTYADIEKKKTLTFKATNAWLGITDKYWAATLIPDTKATINARFSFNTVGAQKTYQTDYLGDQLTVAPGASSTVNTRLFAGAKEARIVGVNFGFFGAGGYNEQLGLNRFDLLIDWGYFYFITKPMFLSIDWLYQHVGNFGVAILLITVLIKLIFFPLANKSYASMAKMKAVQPEMMAIRERYADDKVKQQQALMELYKTEKINPLAGCLPILIQVPVFFALYKVLFVSLEMRHAPFIGWIKDLSAPDPTNLFNLFGLIPYDPTIIPVIGQFLHLGFWPIIMGITMFFQMKLNPAPPDPTQKMIFDWMPLIFTFMLASFSAGLVIYWAWNNTLSVLQQSVIMHKNGAKIELWDNLKSLFAKKKPPDNDNKKK
ncbi:MAG: membrane protein insertase YidC [Pseudomonadota bacterium]